MMAPSRRSWTVRLPGGAASAALLAQEPRYATARRRRVRLAGQRRRPRRQRGVPMTACCCQEKATAAAMNLTTWSSWRVSPRSAAPYYVGSLSLGVAMVEDSMRVTEQLGSPGTSEPDPLRAAEDPGTPSLPPVVLFLPGLSTLPHNTSARLADVMCADLTAGR